MTQTETMARTNPEMDTRTWTAPLGEAEAVPEALALALEPVLLLPVVAAAATGREPVALALGVAVAAEEVELPPVAGRTTAPLVST